MAPSKCYSALAAGRPIAAICGDTSYLRDLIETAQCGQSFANGDHEGLAQFIRQLIRRPEVAARLGQAGRQYCETHFTPAIIAQEYQQVLFPAMPFSQERPQVAALRNAPVSSPPPTQKYLEWLGSAPGTGPEARESHSI